MKIPYARILECTIPCHWPLQVSLFFFFSSHITLESIRNFFYYGIRKGYMFYFSRMENPFFWHYLLNRHSSTDFRTTPIVFQAFIKPVSLGSASLHNPICSVPETTVFNTVGIGRSKPSCLSVLLRIASAVINDTFHLTVFSVSVASGCCLVLDCSHTPSVHTESLGDSRALHDLPCILQGTHSHSASFRCPCTPGDFCPFSCVNMLVCSFSVEITHRKNPKLKTRLWILHH